MTDERQAVLAAALRSALFSGEPTWATADATAILAELADAGWTLERRELREAVAALMTHVEIADSLQDPHHPECNCVTRARTALAEDTP